VTRWGLLGALGVRHKAREHIQDQRDVRHEDAEQKKSKKERGGKSQGVCGDRKGSIRCTMIKKKAQKHEREDMERKMGAKS